MRNPVKKVRSIRDRCFNNEIQLQSITCAKAMRIKGIFVVAIFEVVSFCNEVFATKICAIGVLAFRG